MFIETYYDETRSGFDGTGERLIPYPELVGEELAAWRQFLPIKHPFGMYSWELGVPAPVLSEVRLLRAARLFDKVEIWARKDPDPMAVGIIAPASGRTRYYSIARWGDAEITLDEVKRKLRLQEVVSGAILSAAILLVMVSIFLVFSA
ncbi:MAG TPA: hypothetical protein VFY96_02655 [Candidatus Binatia bacterium]|nr:hypothetical protein [Candidatus Binatia bacterium]